MRLGARLLILCCIAIVRAVYFAIEQPGTSLFIHFPYLKFVIDMLKGYVDIDINRLLGAHCSNRFLFRSILNTLPILIHAQLDGLVWRQNSKSNNPHWQHVWVSSGLAQSRTK